MLRTTFVITLLFCFIANGFGQVMYDGKEANIKDDTGKKIGTWVFYAKDKNTPGFPPEAVVEAGDYTIGRKSGVWKKFYPSGNVKSEINFKNGRISGEFTTYHDKSGAISESGSMNGRAMAGPHKTVNEDGVVTIEKNYGDDGRMQGPQIFRHKNGQVEFQFEKKAGKNVGTATRYYPNGDVKELTVYNDDGTVKSSEKKPKVNPAYKDPTPPKLAKKAPPLPSDAYVQIDGKIVRDFPDGKQKVFSKAGDILYDGFFERGEFKDGEYYVYDEDGLILHIEVFKNFRYVAKGVIKD
ncbi:MAG: antitoxin component YwqK of YwqJK toxin-antitoxin module [Parvicellaceae bacterium]|jgi:antitoxin component YwqK of YwqJK toxin-antitoxin module